MWPLALCAIIGNVGSVGKKTATFALSLGTLAAYARKLRPSRYRWKRWQRRQEECDNRAIVIVGNGSVGKIKKTATFVQLLGMLARMTIFTEYASFLNLKPKITLIAESLGTLAKSLKLILKVNVPRPRSTSNFSKFSTEKKERKLINYNERWSWQANKKHCGSVLGYSAIVPYNQSMIITFTNFDKESTRQNQNTALSSVVSCMNTTTNKHDIKRVGLVLNLTVWLLKNYF